MKIENKNENNISDIIYGYQKEICYLKQMQDVSTCWNEKVYYINLIEDRTQGLINYFEQCSLQIQETNPTITGQKEFTIEELAAYDGSNGKPAFVAVNSVVYDMSSEITWGGGTHFGLYAGKDVSAPFIGCHQGMLELLEKFEKVGVLK